MCVFYTYVSHMPVDLSSAVDADTSLCSTLDQRDILFTTHNLIVFVGRIKCSSFVRCSEGNGAIRILEKMFLYKQFNRRENTILWRLFSFCCFFFLSSSSFYYFILFYSFFPIIDNGDRTMGHCSNKWARYGGGMVLTS